MNLSRRATARALGAPALATALFAGPLGTSLEGAARKPKPTVSLTATDTWPIGDLLDAAVDGTGAWYEIRADDSDVAGIAAFDS